MNLNPEDLNHRPYCTVCVCCCSHVLTLYFLCSSLCPCTSSCLHRRARRRSPRGTVSAPTWSGTRRRYRVTSVGSCCLPLTSPTTWGSTTSRSTTPVTCATAVSRTSRDTFADSTKYIQALTKGSTGSLTGSSVDKDVCVFSSRESLVWSFTSVFLFVLSDISLILLFTDRFRWQSLLVQTQHFLQLLLHIKSTLQANQH